MEIGRVQVSDLDAIGTLHAHFWGEVSDVDAMAQTSTFSKATPTIFCCLLESTERASAR